MRRRAKTFLAAAVVLLLLFGAWEAAVRLLHVPAFIAPPPSRVALVFISRLPLLMHHAATTLVEIVLGMTLGTASGIALALLVFYSPVLERALYPLIIASQMVPIFAVAPVLILWLGYGLWPKVTVAALITFFPIVISTEDGLRAAGAETVSLLRSMRATRWQVLTKLRIPAGLPSLFSGLKVGVTLSVVGATIGEWVGAQRGLGYLMNQSNARFAADVVFAAILMLSLLGLLLFAALRIIEWRVLRWRQPVSPIQSRKGDR